MNCFSSIDHKSMFIIPIDFIVGICTKMKYFQIMCWCHKIEFLLIKNMDWDLSSFSCLTVSRSTYIAFLVRHIIANIMNSWQRRKLLRIFPFVSSLFFSIYFKIFITEAHIYNYPFENFTWKLYQYCFFLRFRE